MALTVKDFAKVLKIKDEALLERMKAAGLPHEKASDEITPADKLAILKSLKETSISHEELGMYWKENSGGWFWYQAPIETQALLIEAWAYPPRIDAYRLKLVGELLLDGNMAKTQEMLDFCAKHNITPEIEVIAPDQVNVAYERVLKSDVRYRFVIDMAKI